jgi:hypothetical protein
MSANQQAMLVSIKAAAVVAATTKAANVTAVQGIITVAASAVGFRPGFPAGYATYAAAVASAATQLLVNAANVEVVRQGAEQVAKDLLRSQGEIAY